MISVGMYIAYLQNDYTLQWNVDYNFRTLIVFLSLSIICGATFITNQLSDSKSDTINKKLFIVDSIINNQDAQNIYKYSIYVGGILLLLSFSIYNIIIGISIFFIWDRLYNKEPYQCKNNPFLGPLCNLLVGFLLIFSGWIVVHSNNQSLSFSYLYNFLLLIIPYLLCYLSVAIITDIPDIEGDKSIQKNTFTLIYGKKTTLVISTLLVLLAFLISYYLNDPLGSIITVVSFPFFLFALFRGYNKDILRAIRYPIFIMNFFVMTIFPVLFIFSIVVFYFSKYYYWHRFDIHYPTFIVDND
tara:strand:- start:1352 stop:2251 length:900 start_codon:yes stop_codon:yes gene_type:complete